MKAFSLLLIILIKKMSVVPDPIIAGNWDEKTPLYVSLSKERDFKESIDDILARAGTPDEVIAQMTRDNSTYEELAKCFIPAMLDPVHNYELYEMIGDQTLNKATFNYLFRILFPRISNVEKKVTVGYMDTLKQFYISTKFYSRLAQDIGFSEFLHRVCYRRQNILVSIVGRDSKNLEQVYEDLMEAFVGCLELLLDRYVGMHRGYAYVANFVYDLLSDIHINFDARQYWSSHRILKEANDRIFSHNQQNPQDRLKNFRVQNQGRRMVGVSVFEIGRGGNAQLHDVEKLPGINMPFEYDNKDSVEEAASASVIEYMKRIPRYAEFIKEAPTPAQLNIQDLVIK